VEEEETLAFDVSRALFRAFTFEDCQQVSCACARLARVITRMQMLTCAFVHCLSGPRRRQYSMLNPKANHEPCEQVIIREVQYHMLGYGHTVWEAGGLAPVFVSPGGCVCERRRVCLRVNRLLMQGCSGPPAFPPVFR
jgi:hypothetical protein